MALTQEKYLYERDELSQLINLIAEGQGFEGAYGAAGTSRCPSAQGRNRNLDTQERTMPMSVPGWAENSEGIMVAWISSHIRTQRVRDLTRTVFQQVVAEKHIYGS